MPVCVLSHFSHVQLFVTYGLQPVRLLCPWHSPGMNGGVGNHALLQGTVPIRALNPHLLNCMWILHPLSHLGSPKSRYLRFISNAS